MSSVGGLARERNCEKILTFLQMEGLELKKWIWMETLLSLDDKKKTTINKRVISRIDSQFWKQMVLMLKTSKSCQLSDPQTKQPILLASLQSSIV